MTMKRPLPSLLASTLLLSAGHALAGSDLSVTGRIQSGACNLALGNGGTIDLGTIMRKDLKESDLTYISPRDVTLAIDCQTPTKVAIKSINNRENAYGAYGLGLTGSKNWFTFFPFDRVGDGKPLVHLRRPDGFPYWETTGDTNSAWSMSSSSLNSWAEEGESLPQAFRTIRSNLSFYITLPALSDLDLSQEIALDGSATLELVYL